MRASRLLLAVILGLVSCGPTEPPQAELEAGTFTGLFYKGWEWSSFVPCSQTSVYWYMAGNIGPILALRTAADSGLYGYAGIATIRGVKHPYDATQTGYPFMIVVDTVLAAARRERPVC